MLNLFEVFIYQLKIDFLFKYGNHVLKAAKYLLSRAR